MHRDVGSGGINVAEIIRREFDGDSPDIFLQAMQLRSPGIGTIHGFWASTQASAI
jgi:hypothetical protein